MYMIMTMFVHVDVRAAMSMINLCCCLTHPPTQFKSTAGVGAGQGWRGERSVLCVNLCRAGVYVCVCVDGGSGSVLVKRRLELDSMSWITFNLCTKLMAMKFGEEGHKKTLVCRLMFWMAVCETALYGWLHMWASRPSLRITYNSLLLHTARTHVHTSTINPVKILLHV